MLSESAASTNSATRASRGINGARSIEAAAPDSKSGSGNSHRQPSNVREHDQRSAATPGLHKRMLSATRFERPQSRDSSRREAEDDAGMGGLSRLAAHGCGQRALPSNCEVVARPHVDASQARAPTARGRISASGNALLRVSRAQMQGAELTGLRSRNRMGGSGLGSPMARRRRDRAHTYSHYCIDVRTRARCAVDRHRGRIADIGSCRSCRGKSSETNRASDIDRDWRASGRLCTDVRSTGVEEFSRSLGSGPGFAFVGRTIHAASRNASGRLAVR